jgi:predicted Zn-dependent protease
MIKKTTLALTLAATTLATTSCLKVPVTGRRQVNLLPESILGGMAKTQYQQFLSTNAPMQASDNNVAMVRRAGDKIAKAVALYLKQTHQSKRIEGFKWEFNVVNDNTVNAWCMPGGKVVVYTGLLPVTQTEGALAIVMGHEIAHAIARHGNERMSQGLAVQAAGIGAQVFLATKGTSAQGVQLFNQAFGVTSQLGILKYSRMHESEADKMGLIFAAMAGYNPEEAIAFWQRMGAQGGGKPPEILSTHPSDETRIKDLKAFMPRAKSYYKPMAN